MKKGAVIFLFAIGWLLSSSAHAISVLDQWGGTARTDHADCVTPANCSNFLFLALEDGESVGGSQSSSATIGSALAGSTTNLMGRGSAGAEIVIPGSGLALPVLRARAESTDGDGWVSGSALGIQGYTFGGSDGTELNLDVTLDGTVTNPSGSATTGLEVNVWILKSDAPFTFPMDPVPTDELIAQIIVDSFLAGIDPFIATLTWDIASNGTGAISRSTATTDPGDRITFTVDDEEQFYLIAGLSASATGVGASALSWSTLTFDFDSTELVAASAVPLPLPAVLLGSGLFCLIFVRRR